MGAQPDLFTAPAPGRFYETVPLTQPEARSARQKAAAQEIRIAAIFNRTGRPMSPWEVHAAGGGDKTWPITSVRARITSLTEAGALVKTGITRIGAAGAREHLWRLA